MLATSEDIQIPKHVVSKKKVGEVTFQYRSGPAPLRGGMELKGGRVG